MRKFLLLNVLIISYLSIFSQNLVRGADIGWLSEMEQSNRVWRDSLGVQRDLLDILNDYCINTIRLRVWVNPTNGWSGKQDVINLAKRAKAKGYRLMIDFHYSDSWADPGQQTKPAAWANYTVAQLEQAVYDHTVEVLNALKTESITPEFVQVGNETNDGMLWPEGRASTNNNANMVNYAKFVDKGYAAVKSVFPNAKVVVHVANGFDNGLFRWNIGGLVSNNARFDVIGMSMYPETAAEWQTYSSQANTNMQDMVTRYGKEIIVSEIGLPTANAAEGKLFVEQTIKNIQALSGNKGLGVLWWEPQAYNWKGYGKVAWNTGTGNAAYQATDAMKGFKYNCSSSTPKDCNGQSNGTAYVDNCQICVGGNTGKTACGTVNVTFKVDMKGQSTANGVYITGAMTANNGTWQILQMTSEGNNIYSRTFRLSPSDTGAYYFLNSTVWASRETVPANCANSYHTDRSYLVGNKNQLIQDTWASCTQIVTHLSDESQLSQIQLFPNPFTNTTKVYLVGEYQYAFYSLDGKVMETARANEEANIGSSLQNGTYILQLIQEDKAIQVLMYKQ